VIDLIRSEWIKFRSVRSNVLLVLAAGGVVVLLAFTSANQTNNDRNRVDCPTEASTGEPGSPTTVDPGAPVEQCDRADGALLAGAARTHLSDVTIGIPFALFLFGALGVQIIGQEYRFSTIRTTFTAVPRRKRVLAAKFAVVSLACAAVSVVMIALCAGIGALVLDGFSIDSMDHRVILGIVLFNVGWTGMGMGVGAIIRQPVAAILVLLAEAFVVENILLATLPDTGSFLPFLNGIQMTVRDDGGEGLRSVFAGGVYFFVFAAAVWAVGLLLVDRRDA
jgi:ABC-2 type transport system permease protein